MCKECNCSSAKEMLLCHLKVIGRLVNSINDITCQVNYYDDRYDLDLHIAAREIGELASLANLRVIDAFKALDSIQEESDNSPAVPFDEEIPF